MIMKKISAYLFGYVVLDVRGIHPERFINMSFTRGIQLWDLSWDDTDRLTAKAFAQSFRSLRHIAKQSNCRIRILEKQGLPFTAFRFRRRRMLLVGAMAFCLILYFLSSLVWTVDIIGAEKTSVARVRNLAAAKGLRPGNFRFTVQRDQVENYILRELPGVSYAEVNIGPRSQVKIVEKVVPPPSQGICNVVAKKDGVIHSILALKGQAMVEEGDLVRKGQVLVSGTIYPPTPEEDPSSTETPPAKQKPLGHVSAQGLVYGKFWYRCYGEAPREEILQEETGKSARIYCINLNGKEMIIKGPRKIPYKYYKAETQRSRFPDWRNKTLPVEFVTIDAKEVKHTRLRRNFEETVKAATDLAKKKETRALPKGAVPLRRQYKVLGTEDDQIVRVVLTVETKEDIGVIQKFKP